MSLRRLIALAVALPAGALARELRAQPPVPLVRGLVITRSTRIAPGTYRLRAPAGTDSALVVIRGDDLTVDLRGVTLIGTREGAPPDSAAGVAVRVEGGAHVTVRGGTIRGYKVALLAGGTRQLRLLDLDVSHNWKPRLYSLVEHESLADWLSYHHNEQDEWLRYGAAIYLRGVRGGEVRGVRAEQGMNGLLMTRTDSVLVWNSTFSYLSGLGIGLYRSSDNRLMHNRVDYDVRGYSHGFYRRGQDSAGILAFEQSCRNVIAFNSVTHGGDGFFLWAGQETMDSGAGGANDNVLYANDFSHAPTNGIEVTFSRNVIVGNRVEENDHGIWGGYSYESVIAGNRFARNRIGIAIEHGQDNAIVANTFAGDSTGIRLWWNKLEPSDWGYPKHRDTRSRDYLVTGNDARALRTWLRVDNTQRLRAADRVDADTLLVASGDTGGTSVVRTPRPTGPDLRMPEGPAPPERDAQVALLGVDASPLRARAESALAHLPRPLAGGQDARLAVGTARGRATIIVDAWGPYDWRSPKLWPEARSDARPLALRVLGPAGRWRVVGRRGLAAVSDLTGRVPGRIVVTPDTSGPFEDWMLELAYVGAATVAPNGVRTAAGQPVRVTYGASRPRSTWQQRIVTWSDSTDPRRDTAAFMRAFASPTLSRATPALDYEWFRPQVAGIPLERWGLEATATLDVPPGDWELVTISDDGVRVWVDGRLVIDHWTAHESLVDRVPLAAGRHAVRVAYYQVDGWTELRLDVTPSSKR
ncbi:MAG: right-handed parallel beta-helix repeat-containing protein [Gemmatimonadetes bacterium]|nr:right-handed parallel beta-helix repeat-containing protein [Gemmatimonadota bacterium]